MTPVSEYDKTVFNPNKKYHLHIDAIKKYKFMVGTHKNDGLIFESSKHGLVLTLNHINHHIVDFVFLDSGSIQQASMGALRKGLVKDYSQPTFLGVGVTGEGCRNYGSLGKKSFSVWKEMLRRCYDVKFLENNETYIGCSVSEFFRYYDNFHQWCIKQVGFGREGFALDKDILIKGNKIYSEDVCVFVPQQINNCCIRSTNRRGEYPVGVSWNKQAQKFETYITRFGKRKNLGLFHTVQEAFLVRKEAKEKYMKELAEFWKDEVDTRVYKALTNWVVSEDD